MHSIVLSLTLSIVLSLTHSIVLSLTNKALYFRILVEVGTNIEHKQHY